MKVRLVGSADIVRACAKKLEEYCGVEAVEYPRRCGHELTVYLTVDDRLVERLVHILESEVE